LRRTTEGEFFVRFSSSERGYFTISYKLEGKSVHKRIKHQPLSSQFEIGDVTYNSLCELIENEKKNLNLIRPCLVSSPFMEIFFGSETQNTDYV